jgi:hypothetical protein
VVELMRAGAVKRGGTGRGQTLAAGEVITEKHRNSTLTSFAGTMRRPGMEYEEILAALLVVNERRCEPPLGEDEVKTIVASVCRYAPAARRQDDAMNRALGVGKPAKDHGHSTLSFTLEVS